MKQNSLSKLFTSSLIIITLLVLSITVAFIYTSQKKASCSSTDKYKNFSDLKKHTREGKDWKISDKHTSSSTIITAIHGGGIEPGTSEVAKEISKKGDYKLYTFEALRKSGNQDLHVTSTHYNEPILLNMMKKSTHAVSIHGMEADKSVVYIGGKDKKLRHAIRNNLRDKGFKVDESPDYLQGDSNDNITNQNDSNAGVQLELSHGLRKTFFKHGDFDRDARDNKSNYRKKLYRFSEAVSNGIKEAHDA
ncbi:poly-gamma-glutamate hydrolase family protein [Staphylococcus sp. SQ8-PEA]|uniref:Poly-gamma-glutamate hydrolase family protein n=1 Tax=Staphylococcus marylandisciuri TaxID=2981529 RepID=A0ABT2QSU9_9STAP|nr:poly-gamma-glutamate hydrolase family protein [Staphylococcus marylandisciuri]MCU5747071.1 poly-gamma-glutamate hydrolase family protein [Staphylococcus marylandisciuri]